MTRLQGFSTAVVLISVANYIGVFSDVASLIMGLVLLCDLFFVIYPTKQ